MVFHTFFLYVTSHHCQLTFTYGYSDTHAVSRWQWAVHMEYCQKRTERPTFFMIPVFRLENVVYRRNLLSMYSIFILTRPLVFFPFDGGDFLGCKEA